jgi:hypothetical protein
MKIKNIALPVILFTCLLAACGEKPTPPSPIIGTWQLISGTNVAKGATTFTDYTKNRRMIKIINATHFAFLDHDIKVAKDSSNNFDAGGGSYTFSGSDYIEHLDYYKDQRWEGKTFHFTVTFKDDTLIQKGLEKVENTNIDRIIIEKYVRIK